MKIIPGSWGGDFSINMANTEHLSGKRILYKLVSKYEDKPVGFYLLLKEPKKGSFFVQDGVILSSLGGDTSNNFLAALSRIYGVKSAAPQFADSVIGTYANLGDMDGAGKEGNFIAAQIKLFFADGSAELYMNIDRNAGTISFPEKDSANRSSLIEAFSKPANPATPAKK